MADTGQKQCSSDERRRAVVAAICDAGGGEPDSLSDTTKVSDFFQCDPNVPQGTLDSIRERIRCRCWCSDFGPVLLKNTVGQLQNRVERQHRKPDGKQKLDCSTCVCCDPG